MAHQVSVMPCPNPNNSVFTLEQCQQLLALINPCSPFVSAVQGEDIHGKDASLTCAPFSSSTMAGIDVSHFVFSAKVVNRRAYTFDIWVIDTGATDHIVCSMNLLSSIIAIAQSIVELPNGETASSHILELLTFLLHSHFIMFYVCLLSLLAFSLLAPSLNLTLPALFSYLLSVLFRTLPVGERLGWGKQMMVCTCYNLAALISILQVLLMISWQVII